MLQSAPRAFILLAMALPTEPAQLARFSVFELDLRSGELRKSGKRVPLQDQPLAILRHLLEHPGQLITREELRHRLWPDDTFVAFEDGLNGAIRRLRDALGDNATTPQFVETLPRRGYRFIAQVTGVAQDRGGAWRRARPWLLGAGVVAVVGSAANWLNLPRAPQQPPTVRFALSTQPLAVLGRSPVMALSPDGTNLVYVAGDGDLGQLFVRRMNSLQSAAVRGASRVQGPFFSPDGNWVAFFTRGALQKVSLGGGSPTTICALPTIYGSQIHGGSWGDDGTIIFESGTRLWRVPAAGGIAQRVDTPEDVRSFFPELLPGGEVVVFTGSRMRPSAQSGVWAMSLQSGRLDLLAEGGGLARYMRSGHLVYAVPGSLVAAPFEASSRKLTAPPVSVVEDLRMELWPDPRVAPLASTGHFSVSQTGTLAYLSGQTVPPAQRTILWVNRDGREDTLPVAPRAYSWPRLSPDASRVAVGIFDGTDAPGNVGIYNLATGAWTRLTSHPAEEGRPLWTPDGLRIAFRSNREGPFHLFLKAADGTGPEERLTTAPNPDRTAWSFSPDADKLVFSELSDRTYDLQLLQLSNRSIRTLPPTPFFKGSPAISPNGRWIAYRADETGRDEIYVRPFPNWDTRLAQVSTSGGRAPVWSGDGQELFFVNGDALMGVPVQTTGEFVHGTPKLLFKGSYVQGPGGARNYDVTRDGRRFIVIKEVERRPASPAADTLVVVLNWSDELRHRVAAGK